jgi:hypothetical protein
MWPKPSPSPTGFWPHNRLWRRPAGPVFPGPGPPARRYDDPARRCLPSQPTLADIEVNGKTVPVIYAPAKTGNIFVLDRRPLAAPCGTGFSGAGTTSSPLRRSSTKMLPVFAGAGKLAWSYQTVHHDLWDMDMPSQPTLADIEVNGKTSALAPACGCRPRYPEWSRPSADRPDPVWRRRRQAGRLPPTTPNWIWSICRWA